MPAIVRSTSSTSSEHCFRWTPPCGGNRLTVQCSSSGVAVTANSPGQEGERRLQRRLLAEQDDLGPPRRRDVDQRRRVGRHAVQPERVVQQLARAPAGRPRSGRAGRGRRRSASRRRADVVSSSASWTCETDSSSEARAVRAKARSSGCLATARAQLLAAGRAVEVGQRLGRAEAHQRVRGLQARLQRGNAVLAQRLQAQGGRHRPGRVEQVVGQALAVGAAGVAVLAPPAESGAACSGTRRTTRRKRGMLSL